MYNNVHQDMPDQSLATVYHTLKELADMGEGIELDLGDGKHPYDPPTHEHHHLVCLARRLVLGIDREFHSLEVSEEAADSQILRRDVVLYGYRPDCQR